MVVTGFFVLCCESASGFIYLFLYTWLSILIYVWVSPLQFVREFTSRDDFHCMTFYDTHPSHSHANQSHFDDHSASLPKHNHTCFHIMMCLICLLCASLRNNSHKVWIRKKRYDLTPYPVCLPLFAQLYILVTPLDTPVYVVWLRPIMLTGFCLLG